MAVTETTYSFIRAGRASRRDLFLRMPELSALSDKVVAVFGLGCIGGPSAFELVRAGVGELRVLDHDIVDPGTIGRWPIGLSAAGVKKVDVVREVAGRDYPYVKVIPVNHRLGATRLNGPSDQEQLAKMTDGAQLIYDATTEWGVQHFLSEYARDREIPYIAVDGTQGGWGGRICRITPGQTEGCWLCFQAALTAATITPPAVGPDEDVQPEGCGDPTFKAAGFDMAQIALAGVRVAVATLCRGIGGGYPPYPWDVTIMSFRDRGGELIAPRFDGYSLDKHNDCPRCGGQ